ncbi:VOC family protein [Eubacteriales bacterium OttesenSCG-928-K08]|nr:VOC family protein [Eubacteriales bacterium OttesenSCG-928-K08]
MIIPYITFSGNCRKALDFYSLAFGATTSMLQPYGDYVPEGIGEPPADLKDWVLHAEMEICGAKFWFADECVEPVLAGSMVKLTATVPTRADAQEIFDRLKQNATITLPPTQTFYCTFHAALIDQYGMCWNIVSEEAPE